MSFSSLLTVLSDDRLANTTVKKAAELAGGCDAHLDCLCIGVDRSQTGYYYAGATALIVEQSLNQVREEARRLETLARAHLGNTDIRWSVETGVTQITELSRHIAARARFSDLVVVPTPYGENKEKEMPMIVESALFEASVPVLVMPDNASLPYPPNTITVAWNESSEALVAAKAALGLLREAELVRVVVVDPPAHGPNRSDPGGALSQFLARHGVRVEVDVITKSMPRVSDVLLRHAQDKVSDLIVMGAYGHSRFRESVLGGATRHMLEQAKVPVFMAH